MVYRLNSVLRSVLILLLLVSAAGAQVVINEFLASNQAVLPDEDGEFSDWIELHNPTDTPVNLQGWFLTDNANNLTKWQFPNTNIVANGYLIIFASNKNRVVPGQPLHTSFALSADGEYLGLVLPDGQTVVSEFAPAFPAQFRDVSYGLWEGEERYFATPTPGATNSSNFYAKVADTKFNYERGFYELPFNLVISTATEGATIRFTTNGAPPSSLAGMIFAGPIPISRTTVLRAAAFKTGYAPSDVDTQTYIFLDDVIFQSTNGLAPPGWPATWGANRVDYGMDPKVINDARYSGTLKNDLKTIPTVSLVMKLEDLFDARSGIYANSTQTGINWERPASLELIYPDGTAGFQVNAGIRIRGNFSASSTYPKHSFRGFFRSEYGDKSLKYPLFGDNGTESFPGGVDLATFQNHAWANWGNPGGTNALFLRDHFGRDTQLAMGHQGERGIYTHLYINGQYWGIYSPSERPEASFAATHYGGQEEDYDVIKATGNTEGYVIEATDGDMQAWARLWQYATNGFTSDAAYQRVQGNHPDGSRNPAYDVLVDVENLIDYQLIVAYTGSRDAPVGASGTNPNNWYGIYRRDGSMGFRFFVHDFEHSLLNVNENRIGPYIAGTPGTGGGLPKSSPQYIWQQLQENAEFRMRVADHVHRHFFNGGVLTVEACLARFKARTNQLHHALVGESARWGDADPNHDIAYTRDDEWLPLVGRMLSNYFPQRSSIVLNQLKAKNLYPAVVAPSFSQHGGNVTNGFPVSMSAPAGTIYFARDGSDPRLPGGGLSSTAQAYTGPVALFENGAVKARVLSGGTWSALNEAAFLILRDFTGLLITEIMYHPPDEGEVDGNDFEFLELKNVGSEALDLSGVHFTSGIQFGFPQGTILTPGEFLVLVSNPTAFVGKYPLVAFAGSYSGRLANSGEKITLADAAGTPIISLTYADKAPWPVAADGQGFSLVPRNPNLNPDPNDAAHWRASAQPGGSPGADDPSPNLPAVVINEILAHTDLPMLDAIELHNPTDADADVSHWFLTDNRTVQFKFQIPAGTVIPPGGYVVFTADHFNANPASPGSFLLSSTGEDVYLFSADAGGNLTGHSDGFSFGASANGVSFGRHVTSTGETKYPAQITTTFGAANAGPRVGPVVINEIRYAPVAGEEEFIELKNITGGPVKLFDPAFPTNTWKLNGVGFTFPMGVELPSNGLAILTAGDPVLFRTRYNVPAAVLVFGPWSGLLQDNGELLQLQRPDAPNNGPGGEVTVPYITVDDVRYRDQPPWPVLAAESGSSLERINAAAYGNDPINWKSRHHGATPGQENDLHLPPLVNAGTDLQFTTGTFPLLVPLIGSVLDDGPPETLTISWSQVRGPAEVFFTSPTLSETSVSLPKAGSYVLRLSANDGQWQAHHEMTIQLNRVEYPVTLIPMNAVWKYLDNGSNQGTAWRNPGFNDSTWASGPAQLGYGDGDEATVISYGPASTNKFITAYFRKVFHVPDAHVFAALTVSVLRDDGAVVYLNGVEVFRSNMPGGTITYTTLASSVVGGADESTFYPMSVNPTLLVSGNNVLAVEIHQANVTSSDCSFDLELSGLSLGTNQPPTVSAGSDLVITLPQDAALHGLPADDGLPLVPGVLQLTWNKFTGPGDVVLANPNAATTSASFSASGIYSLRLTVHDGVFTASGHLNVYVLPETFVSWAATFFSAAELNDPDFGAPGADPDGDGYTNEEEYTAGTDPRDAQSFLHIEEYASASSGGLALRFRAAPRRTYSIQYCDVASDGGWSKLTDVGAEAVARPVEIVDSVSPVSSRYYRVVTPAQP